MSPKTKPWPANAGLPCTPLVIAFDFCRPGFLYGLAELSTHLPAAASLPYAGGASAKFNRTSGTVCFDCRRQKTISEAVLFAADGQVLGAPLARAACPLSYRAVSQQGLWAPWEGSRFALWTVISRFAVSKEQASPLAVCAWGFHRLR